VRNLKGKRGEPKTRGFKHEREPPWKEEGVVERSEWKKAGKNGKVK